MKTNFFEQLKEYMANRTPEQIREDEELLDKWKNVGPTVEEYLESIGFKGFENE